MDTPWFMIYTQCGTFIRLSCLSSSVMDYQIMVSLLGHYLCKKYDLPKTERNIWNIIRCYSIFEEMCIILRAHIVYEFCMFDELIKSFAIWKLAFGKFRHPGFSYIQMQSFILSNAILMRNFQQCSFLAMLQKQHLVGVMM